MIANIIFIITVSLLHSNVGFELTKMAVWRDRETRQFNWRYRFESCGCYLLSKALFNLAEYKF